MVELTTSFVVSVDINIKDHLYYTGSLIVCTRKNYECKIYLKSKISAISMK